MKSFYRVVSNVFIDTKSILPIMDYIKKEFESYDDAAMFITELVDSSTDDIKPKMGGIICTEINKQDCTFFIYEADIDTGEKLCMHRYYLIHKVLQISENIYTYRNHIIEVVNNNDLFSYAVSYNNYTISNKNNLYEAILFIDMILLLGTCNDMICRIIKKMEDKKHD